MKRSLNRHLARIFSGCLLVLGLMVNFSTQAKASISSITIDAETGEVLSSSGADILRYPASLTKVMTLYITFDALEKGLIKLDDELPVSRTAANRSPSKLGLRPGSTIDVKTCIMALIVKSANDCATVLAEGLGYSEENFAKTMTRVSRELGMKNTTFKNASGLPNRQQKTTARDMALLAAAMYHHFPQYYKWFSETKFTYQGKTIYTHNYVLKKFEGADGLKTGFTNAAGFNIITSAERDGHRVIAVTMGHNTAKERDKKVVQMMSKGLSKLALNDKVNSANMYANLEEKKLENEATTQVASAQPTLPKEQNWDIQVGAFSNYAKARNYALEIKQKSRKLANKEIIIEPVSTGSAIIYRSKIAGFAKREADAACKSLKKTNKSCIVVAKQDNDQLILAQNQYQQQ